MFDMKIKTLFFDRQRVLKAVDSARRKVLSKFGAFVRQRARSSIRPGGKGNIVSKPGQPPRSHVGLLKRFLFFAFDETSKSVVIGPAKINTGTEAPSVLEHGGTTLVRGTRHGQTISRQVRIAPRPYMGPADAAERSKLDPLWANSVK